MLRTCPPSENRPAGQGTELFDEMSGHSNPGLQDVHIVCKPTLNVPRGQGSGKLETDAQLWPSGHGVHAVAFLHRKNELK
jgi:hypothetical protein